MKPIEWDDLSGGTEAQVDNVRLTIHGDTVNATMMYIVNVDDHDVWIELNVEANYKNTTSLSLDPSDLSAADETARKLIGILNLMRTRTNS